jgi:peptide-methionine (S)-S-oxide reductase
MKKTLFPFALFMGAFGLFSFSINQTHHNPERRMIPKQKEAVATFSEGCFWCSEEIFQSLLGVRDAVSGYSGGTQKNPTYDEVSDGKTGHAESVQVYYDPSKISFSTLVAAFFASHDPTTLNRQGPDEGTQYRSIAFYRNPDEKRIIDSAIRAINASKKYKNPVITQVLPFSIFYEAEKYHQEYISRHPNDPYVMNVSIPRFEKFKKEFKGPFKKE